MIRKPLLLGAAALAAALAVASSAGAFVHVVLPGETLAQIAQRVYGDARYEPVVASANHLDAYGSSAIAAGMHLELPASAHHTVVAGEGWVDLATRYLGDERRAELLAVSNHGVPWVPPKVGQEIAIPYALAHMISEGDTLGTLSKRYWGDSTRGWEIDKYNGRAGKRLERGEIVLVPLVDLTLTEQGRAEARRAEERDTTEAAGDARAAQRHAEEELPRVEADLRGGRYVEALARASRLTGGAPLANVQRARVQRALLECYVAFDAKDLAKDACSAYREADPSARFDPVLVSPKIRAACGVP